MGTKLNPDGSKIRSLRVQRGWTQEQLAEIAGISLRTIQRAEAANSAAFETVRALAAAFEADFEQLIKPEPRTAPIRETPAAITSAAPHPDYEFEPVRAEQRASSSRRIWTISLTAGAALAAGLFAGILLTTHLNRPSTLPAPTSQIASLSRPPAGNPQAALTTSATISKPLSMPRILPPREIKTAILHQESEKIDENPGFAVSSFGDGNVNAPASEVPASLGLIPQPASFDLPLQSQSLYQPPAVPLIPVESKGIAVVSGDSVQEDPESGAVRQALGTAVNKTGDFVSRAKASLKRVF